MTSVLRQRMLDAMALSGKAARTQEAYIGAVIGLARHYRRSPDRDVRHHALGLFRLHHDVFACSRLDELTLQPGVAPV